jgi:CheY-like chemotaxis protein
MYKFFMRGYKDIPTRKDKENESKYENNNKESSQIDSSSLQPPSTPIELDTSNLIVVGVIKADEHSRLTFTKRIKSVFPIFPGNTVVIYQDTISNDLIFKVQHDKVISDTWIVKKKKYDVEPFSNTTVLNKVSEQKNANLIKKFDKNKLLHQTKKFAKIMIVDDDSDSVEVFHSLLLNLNNKNEQRYEIDAFTSSTDAIKKFLDASFNNDDSSAGYDLVIIDVKMPNINGVQLYQILKIIDLKIKFLFVSALDISGELAGILPGIQIEDIFKKPFDADQFVLKVKEKIES